VAEALHRGAFQALVDHLVEREQAALPRPAAVGEGDGGRIESRRERRLGVTRRAVARRAILGIEGRPPRRIRKALRGERHRIGRDQVGGEGMGDAGDLGRRGPAPNRRLQPVRVGGQPSLGRALRKRSDPLADRARKLHHLLIFGNADDLSAPDGARIIDRYVIEQPPAGLHIRLLRRGGRGHEQAEKAEQERGQTADHGRLAILIAIDYQ
jgi:hypothetical protein